MSGVLSKAGDAVQWLRDFHTPWLRYITEQTGMSDNKVKVGLATLTGAAGLLLWKLISGPSNLPPGPRPLPLMGNMIELTKSPAFYIGLHDMKQKYGDILTVYLGPMRCVVLSSHELVKEAFVKQAATNSDRKMFLMIEILSYGGKDIVAANFSERLLVQRKLAHQALRKFSSGGGLQRYTSQAFSAMSAELDKNPRLDGTEMGFLVMYNILLSMCFGKTFSFEDEFFQEMMALSKQQDEFLNELSVADFASWGRYLPLSKGNKAMKAISEIMMKYISDTLEEHKESFDKDNLHDFTDLINAMNEAENDPNERNSLKLLDATNYSLILLDLFLAGANTSRHTLNWIWHYLAAFPEVQRKAQEEIDSVLGCDGEVTSASREKLPYVEAFLHEVMRIKPVVPVGLVHENNVDIKLVGYDIPKGTGLMCNTWSIQLDEKYWKDPEAFLPERWLDENGKYLYQQTGFVAFSMGRRSCIGESFVKLELHMLTTMLLQRYTLEPTPGYRVSTEGNNSFAVQPVDQQPIIARRR